MASPAGARPITYARAVTGFARNVVFAPRYRPEELLTIVTEDGLRLGGARLEGPADAFASVVLVHGFLHSARHPRIRAFATQLAREVHVVVPELRGHGRSEGVSTLGVDEPTDVAAAVEAARSAQPELPVITVGVSLGGVAALLHAGSRGGVAGVVAISSPAWWGEWDTESAKRLQRWATTRSGRFILAHVVRTRLADDCCEGVLDARERAAAISPAFTLVVHDPDDPYFGREHPDTLMEWAREPKELWLEEGAGHGTDLLTPSLASRLLIDLRRRLVAGRAPSH